MSQTDGMFGALILRERTMRRWSVRDLAAASGVSLHAISRAERGLSDPCLSVALKLAGALGIDLSCLARQETCLNCYWNPPAGFTCNECGRGEPL